VAKDKEGIIGTIVNFISMLCIVIKGEFMEDGRGKLAETLMNFKAMQK